MKQYLPAVEALHCCLVRYQQYSFLVSAINSVEFVERFHRVAGPICYVHYGLRSLKVQDIMFPVRVVSDYGAVYTGMKAIDWIIKKGLAHPRADVDCVSSNVTMTSCMLRELDLSVVPVTYVSTDPADFPGKRVSAVICVDGSIDSDVYSRRLRHCLPVIYINDGDDIIRSVTHQMRTLI